MKIKSLLLNKLNEILDLKIETAKKAIESAKESRDNDTKSSAGDKYETGRAMMQMEMDKSELQLHHALNLKNELHQINIKKTHEKAEFGSLVRTNQGNYFIALGIGKIIINNESYYAISLASPIGELLHGKSAGDNIMFKEKEIVINEIS